MTTWIQQDLSDLLAPEEFARREQEDDVIRRIWDEKHLPKNIVWYCPPPQQEEGGCEK